MARQPADVLAASKWSQGRETIWAAVRKLRAFTLTELWRAVECEIPKGTVESYLQGLVSGGYVTKQVGQRKPGRFVAARYELARDTGVDAPKVRRDGTPVEQGARRGQMWRTMRMLGDFSPQDLAVAASTAKTTVSAIDAGDYCKYLRKAGYLRCVQASKPGTQAVYSFVKARYTGPKPPQVQRVKQVFDPNVGEVVWPKGWAHE